MERIIARNVAKRFRIGCRKNQGILARVISLFSGRTPRKLLWAVKGVSFRIGSGEIVGLIGTNGCGKSTLLRTIAGIYHCDRGRVRTNGKLLPLIGLNWSLQARLSMRDNTFLIGSLFDMSRREIARKFNSIARFAELEKFTNTKVYQFSEGMKQRLVFSIAAHCRPDILLIDEVFEVGDQGFKQKSVAKIRQLVKKGAAVIMVSHHLWLIEKYCHRVIWMEEGQIVKQGTVEEILPEYKKAKGEVS